MAGVEPAPRCRDQILSLARLPIPSHRRKTDFITNFFQFQVPRDYGIIFPVMGENNMSRKILIVDGHSILNRAFYGVPPLTNSKGVPTGGLYGFMNILFKILEQENPTHIAVAFDRHEPTFRHEMFEGYKGTRKPMPEELRAQVPILKELLLASDITVMEKAGFEADDLIGTLSKRCEREGMQVVILSGDRDLFQLVSDNITQLIPKTKSGVTTTEVFTPKRMLEEYGVTPLEFIDVKALQGDSSDNIPGVPGVGEKTAQTLISTFHSLENIMEHIEDVTPARAKNAISEHFDMALLSRKLATIVLDAPIEQDSESMKIKNIFTPKAYSLLGSLELKKLMKKFSDSGFDPSGSGIAPKTLSAAPLKKASLIEITGMDPGEADKAFECALGKKTAVAYLDLYGQRRLLFTCDGENVYDIKLAWMIDEEYIREKIDSLSKSGATIIVNGLAGLLREFDPARSGAFFDAEIAAYLLNPLGNSYNYEDIARDFLDGTVLPSKEELFDKKNAPDTGSDAVRDYLTQQVTVIYAAYENMVEALKGAGMHTIFCEVEMPTAFRLHDMEKVGVGVNKQALSDYGKKLGERLKTLEKDIYELAGEEFNINSPKQLGEILFEKMHLPGGKKTKTGYSTAADVLEKLRPYSPLVASILEFRTYSKLKSTYADGLASFISGDGRIHGRFLQTVTATGRISSAEPNLQNIPVREELGREIRKVFIPAKGCVFIDADYSQIELRVLAHLSEDERLISAFKEDLDIHSLTASQVFHVPYDEVSPAQRRAAKAVNFGIVYGESAFGLSENLGISRKEANDYIEGYFRTYPEVKKFLDRQILQAKNNGCCVTSFGRRRPVPELKSANYMQRQFGERVAMNSPIQGTAADIMKMAMLYVSEALEEGGFRSRVVLQVHDELILEVPEAEKESITKLLKNRMTEPFKLKVPLEVSVGTGENWYDTK